MRDKVKFYSVEDWSSGHNLVIAEEIIKEHCSSKKYRNINAVIELYNIQKFFISGMKLSSWTEEEMMLYNQVVKERFKEIIGYFFSKINDQNFISIFKKVDIDYIENFFEIIEEIQKFKSISQEVFYRFLRQKKVDIAQVLRFKNMVNYFGATLKQRLLETPSSGKILLEKYIVHSQNIIYLPKELSTEEKESMIQRYICDKNANLNYLRFIVSASNSKEFSLSDKTRLKALKKIKKLEKNFFSNSKSGFYYGMELKFLDNQIEDKKIIRTPKDNGYLISARYSRRWLKKNLDYATLLNNFIYLFDYVDIQFRFQHTSKKTDMGVFESHTTRSKREYVKGVAFDATNRFAIAQMSLYYKELLDQHIRFEEIIKWFFEEYLKKEFKIKNFKIEIPTEDSSFIEKCRMISPEMEKSLKQYKLWVRDKKIISRLLQFSSPILFSDVSSAVPKKYVYLSNETKIIKQITNLLFSDQTSLGYFGKANKGRTYENLYHALSSRDININEYEEYQRRSIQFLVDNDILCISNMGDIKYIDMDIIIILKDLYYNDVISYWHYPNEIKAKFDNLYEKNYIFYEDTLFSKFEIDYLNFYLNKSAFTNGLDLRNSFLHGTETLQHEESYMIFLMLYVLIIIKINDDLCLYEEYLESGPQ